MSYVHVYFPMPLTHPLTYAWPYENAAVPGERVLVSVGRATRIGLAISCESAPKGVPQLKPVLERLDEGLSLFTDALLAFLKQSSQYYHHPLGDVLWTALPAYATQKKSLPALKPVTSETSFEAEWPFKANEVQQGVIQTIIQSKDAFDVFAINGVTGSGKTFVYQSVIAALSQQRSVLYLVPEIGLVPQTLERLSTTFGPRVVAYHSDMTPKQRLVIWQRVMAKEPLIVIATRSGVFLPFHSLSLIVIDEEHDQAFKQMEGFRYHARNLAIWRASIAKCPVILGSATLSLDTLSLVKERYHQLHLPARADGEMPEIKTISLQEEPVEDGLTPSLRQAMAATLAAENQVLLFVNRRGFAPVLMCLTCRHLFLCKACSARMTLHERPKRLHCHHCGATQPVPKQCPQGHETLKPVGVGTQRLEDALIKQFPDTPISRIDRDTTRKKGAMAAVYEQLQTPGPRIILGTQMIAKGHHFPHIGLVGILDVDAGLFASDFRSTERMGQLITQVGGRAGRAKIKGVVLLQTLFKDNPLLNILLNEPYDAFQSHLMTERSAHGLPPLTHMAIIRIADKNEKTLYARAQQLMHSLVPALPPKVQAMGPAPAPLAKRQHFFQAQLVMVSGERALLHQALSQFSQLASLQFKGMRWSIDVDPMEMA